MERSFGLRAGRPFGLAFPRGRAGARRRPPRGPAHGVHWAPRLPSKLAAAVARARAAIAAVWARRRLRIALVCALGALALLAGGWLWLRSSPLVAVEHVRVTGVAASAGRNSAQIEGALVAAAHRMSTLDVNSARLRAAVASFPVVRSVRAHASFPHGLRIEVREQPPVAVLVAAGVRAAVAADGVVLGSEYVSGSLPVLSADSADAPALSAVGGHVRDGSLRAALSVLGAAPAPVAQTVEKAYSGPKGLTLVLRGGLLAYFGDATRPHAKWLSLARVLADPSSAGAAYVDVRVPEAPAAGFPPGTARPTVAGESEARNVAEPATAQALAAGLNAAVGATGSSSPAAPTGSPSASSPQAESAAPSETGSTSSQSTQAETPAPSQPGSSAGVQAGAATSATEG
jgi:cell division protein FtsQ